MPYPLRKIIAERIESRLVHGHVIEVEVEDLECGHTIRRKSDVFGPTNAIRRRCKKCQPLEAQQ